MKRTNRSARRNSGATSRPKTQCEEFNKEFGGPEGLIERIGNPMLPGYTAPKILWLKENEPANFRRLTSVLLPHDYLNLWLTGERQMEYGDASGTGLMDVRTRNGASRSCNSSIRNWKRCSRRSVPRSARPVCSAASCAKNGAWRRTRSSARAAATT